LQLVAFLLVNAPICHFSLVLASAVQGDAVNCNSLYVLYPHRKLLSSQSDVISLPFISLSIYTCM